MQEPKVSFYIMTYNQELFAASAIEAAFSQDYPELEIVISDDCSSDNTWSVVMETVEKCKLADSRNHKVVLNRNKENLGICRHINKIVSLCSHDIIVCSAGDDVSFPDRVRKTVECFKTSQDIMMVSSQIRYIDETGNFIEGRYNKRYTAPANLENIARGKSLPVGCAVACKRDCYRFLNERDLPEHCSYEDVILVLRACLLGRVAQIKEPLVGYRVSAGSLTNFASNAPDIYKKKAEMARQSLLAVQAQLDDLSFYTSRFPQQKRGLSKVRRILENSMHQKEQSYWIYRYPLYKILLLKSCFLFRGKNIFRYQKEIRKKHHRS